MAQWSRRDKSTSAWFNLVYFDFLCDCCMVQISLQVVPLHLQCSHKKDGIPFGPQKGGQRNFNLKAGNAPAGEEVKYSQQKQQLLQLEEPGKPNRDTNWCKQTPNTPQNWAVRKTPRESQRIWNSGQWGRIRAERFQSCAPKKSPQTSWDTELPRSCCREPGDGYGVKKKGLRTGKKGLKKELRTSKPRRMLGEMGIFTWKREGSRESFWGQPRELGMDLG